MQRGDVAEVARMLEISWTADRGVMAAHCARAKSLDLSACCWTADWIPTSVRAAGAQWTWRPTCACRHRGVAAGAGAASQCRNKPVGDAHRPARCLRAATRRRPRDVVASAKRWCMLAAA